jgi:hypothetical protein
MSYLREGVSLTAGSYPYVTGNGFRNRAHMIWDEHQQDSPEKITQEGQVVFIKTDFVEYFFQNVMPHINHRVKIVTHNSALGIDVGYIQFLDNKKVLEWYAQNANVLHFKLNSVPLGIANKRWAHGNTDLLEEVANSKTSRNHLAYLNFDINTNASARSDVHNKFYNKDYVFCASKKPFKQYLEDLRSSKFCISPQGRGVDCHRIWESIVLGTIPIVKKCNNISFYEDMPILIIDDWSSVDEEFLKQQYDIIVARSKSKIYMDYWIDKILLNKI